MRDSPNAVELTTEQAWFIADATGAGTFPWVLAITPPYTDARDRARFERNQRDALTAMGVMSADGRLNPAVAQWISVVCYCEQWLELRYVGPNTDMMRGIIARRGETTVVALRSAQLVTFTSLPVDHPYALVPVVVAGLPGKAPATFPEFALPARVGARADEQLRSGAKLSAVLDFLGIAPSARGVVESVYTGPRSYVEIVAGARRDGRHATSEVGVGIVDSRAGRVVVSPERATDGEWVSTFAPGTHLAIAMALERLTATLPDGQWFPHTTVAREFTTRTN